MYGQNDFSPDARGHKIVRDFQRFALKCAGVSRHVDGDIPDRYLVDLQTQIRYLTAELRKHELSINSILATRRA